MEPPPWLVKIARYKETHICGLLTLINCVLQRAGGELLIHIPEQRFSEAFVRYIWCETRADACSALVSSFAERPLGAASFTVHVRRMKEQPRCASNDIFCN